MIKYLRVFGLLLVSLPFWLPTSLGGDTSYHFVLTDSMKGSVDAGSFVVLRKSNEYKVGDVVGYWLDLGAEGRGATILHRIVSKLPDGRVVTKGDAVESTEQVELDAIRGRMVFAAPGLGFLPGTFRQSPIFLVTILAVGGLIAGGMKWTQIRNKSKTQRKKEPVAPKVARREQLFMPAVLVVLATIPFASISLADMAPAASAMGPLGALLEQIPLYVFLLGMVAVARMGDVIWNSSPKTDSSARLVVDGNYIFAMAMAAMVVPYAEVMQSARTVLSF